MIELALLSTPPIGAYLSSEKLPRLSNVLGLITVLEIAFLAYTFSS